ncbi:MAG: T9SS type A sorting domain-containing protein [Bacteroidetes bacterium]|nr:T9SS type A sorting domain-containing protein [Bacteroidota bacterium]
MLMKKKIAIIILSNIFIILACIEISKVNEFSYSRTHPYSFQNIVKNDSLIYSINTRSLQIYQIFEDSLSLISETNIQGDLSTISLNNDWIYIATDVSTNRLYRISIIDPTTPIITDTLSFSGSYANFSDGNNLFVNEYTETGTWFVHVYNNDTFDEISFFEVPYSNHSISKLSNGRALIKNQNELFIYDITIPNNIQELSSHVINNTSYPYKGEIVQDTVFIFSSLNSNLKIFDISNPNNWILLSEINEPIPSFEIESEKVICIKNNSILLYDISTINEPVYRDEYILDDQYDYIVDLNIFNNIVLCTSIHGDIYHFYIDDWNIITQNILSSNGMFTSSYLYNNYLYILSRTEGLSIYNISDINIPILFEDNYVHNDNSNFLNGENNILLYYGVNYDRYQFINSIFEINDEGTLNLLNENIDSEFHGALFFKEGCGYFCTYAGYLYKFIMDENNNLVETNCISVPDVSISQCVFFNDVIYLIEPYKLTIINNIYDNPTYVSSCDTNINSFAHWGFYDNYFIVTRNLGFSDCLIFDVSNPLSPSLALTIDKSGPLLIDEENDLLFVGYTNCSVYDLSNIDSGEINEVLNFQNWTHLIDLISFSQNNDNYLLYLEETSCSIYRYSTLQDDIDNEFLESGYKLFNKPNPFHQATEIFFDLTTKHTENTEIQIYNIKGQKVKTFPKHQINDNKIIWDGTNDKGKPVSSGVYLYKMKSGNYVSTKKMILLK